MANILKALINNNIVLLLWKTVTNRSNLWEKLFSQFSPALNLKYRTRVMAKSLLNINFIVKVVTTLLTHTVAKFLMDQNVQRKFYKYFLLEQHRM